MLGDNDTVFQTCEYLGFIDVGDGFWRRNVLATSLRDGAVGPSLSSKMENIWMWNVSIPQL